MICPVLLQKVTSGPYYSFKMEAEILFPFVVVVAIDFIELYIFLCSPPFHSSPFQPCPMVSVLPIYSDLVFYYSQVD